MSANTFLTPARLGKFKGEILSHAMRTEVLGRGGRQVSMPKNSSDTYVARRVIPYGATATNPNQFFATASGVDRGNAMVQAHQTQEGVSSTPDSISFMDVTAVIQQYDCLYMWTNKNADLHEDDIPKFAVEQVGERVGLVNEMILWGVLRSCTNQYYGGAGVTSRSNVAGKLTLNMIRKITKNLQGNHGKMVNSILKASGDFATAPVEAGFFVYGHTDLAPDIRDMPGFIHVKEYASGTAMPGELGAVEDFRFILSPDLPCIQDGGANSAVANGLQTNNGTNVDVYQLIIAGKDAWSQLSVRGLSSLDPTYLPTGKKDKGDPHGQRGYAGTIWYKAAMVENDGWLAIANVGITNLG